MCCGLRARLQLPKDRFRLLCRDKLTEQWRKDNPALISGENSAEAFLEDWDKTRELVDKAYQES